MSDGRAILATPDATISFVRPGRRALEWLAGTIAGLKGDDPFAPVTVIVPNYYAGRQARRALARGGGVGYLNVRTLRLMELAEHVLGPAGAARESLNSVREASAVRAAVDRTAKDGGAFAPVAHHRSLHTTLTGFYRELRRQERDVDTLLPESGGTPTAGAAVESYRAYQALTKGYDDPTALRDSAAAHVGGLTALPPRLAEMGALVLFLPTRLDPADARLVAAMGRHLPLRAALAAFDDPQKLADGRSRQMADLLAPLAGIALADPIDPSGSLTLHAALSVLRAVDPVEEVREAVRRLLAAAEAGVPLHRCAILYRQPDPYAALVRETLDLAGIPWGGLEGRPLAESRSGRALLTLLRLPERRYTRDAVLAWIDTAPVVDGTTLEASLWDRVSRGANVVRGAGQWVQRLEEFARRLEHDALAREADGASGAVEAARPRSVEARQMAATIQALSDDLQPPANGKPWPEFVDWAEKLRGRYGSGETWPLREKRFTTAVGEALRGLAAAKEFEPAARLTLFLDTLQAALEDASLPEFGPGVVVGPAQAVTGLAFEQVHLLGLTEGAFPPAPGADPFFPTVAEDPLDRRNQQRMADRQAFLTAVASADDGRLTLSAPDALAGRAAFPSRWLLEAAAARLGTATLHNAQYRGLNQDNTPWLRYVASAQNGAAHAAPPLDLEDRRIGEVARWTAARHRFTAHPLSRDETLPLRKALAAGAARNGATLSPFDGNLGALAPTSRTLRRVFEPQGIISASRIEMWAGCPFRYFLTHVLRVEPTERPEESWTIDPLDRGLLVHKVLEEFFGELHQTGRPGVGESYTADDEALLDRLAHERCEALERNGQAGHPLLWETTRATLLGDLRTFLGDDQRWRRERGVKPEYFEQDFGTTREGDWPVLTVPAGAQALRFRGSIDRIDVSPDGTRAVLYDYKTGSANYYKGLSEDPVLAGTHVQLALYSRALRAQLKPGAQVDAAYWFVTSKGGFAQVALPENEAAVGERLEAALAVVAEGIGAGAFPQVPGEDGHFGYANCGFCDFDRICPSDRAALHARKQSDPAAAIHARLIPPAVEEVSA